MCVLELLLYKMYIPYVHLLIHNLLKVYYAVLCGIWDSWMQSTFKRTDLDAYFVLSLGQKQAVTNVAQYCFHELRGKESQKDR